MSIAASDPKPAPVRHGFRIPTLVAAGEGSQDARSCGDFVGGQVWHDLQGGVWSRCQEAPDGRFVIDLPGVARFCVDGRRGEVSVTPHRPHTEESLRDTYFRSVVPLALQALGTEVLHASAVQTDVGVVAFCAESRMGKSTLGYLLAERGYPLWSDDTVAFREEGGVTRTFPIPFKSRLRPATTSFLRARSGSVPAPPWLDPGAGQQEAPPLAAICILDRVEAPLPSLVQLSPLSGATALSTLLTHAYCFSMQRQEMRQRMVRNYLDLIAAVPIFRLTFQSGLERVSEVLDHVEQALGENLLLNR